MAKYDWKQLEKEYILGDYKSVSAFLKEKEIPNNGSTKKSTKGWKEKKGLKEDKKSTKIIEKVLEKESEKEAEKIVTVNVVANKLLEQVLIASEQLNKDVDMFGNLHENEVINRADIKKLTSALKDIRDILGNKENENIQRIQIINDLPGDEDEIK